MNECKCTELAEGMNLRRRQSAPRLATFPRLLAKVTRLAKAGRRGEVVRILTLVERWMASHPSHARLLPREIASLMGPARASGAAGAAGADEGEEGIEVHDYVDLSDEPDLVDMETWVLDLVVVREVKAEPSSEGEIQGCGLLVVVKEEEEEEEEAEEGGGSEEGEAATGASAGTKRGADGGGDEGGGGKSRRVTTPKPVGWGVAATAPVNDVDELEEEEEVEDEEEEGDDEDEDSRVQDAGEDAQPVKELPLLQALGGRGALIRAGRAGLEVQSGHPRRSLRVPSKKAVMDVHPIPASARPAPKKGQFDDRGVEESKTPLYFAAKNGDDAAVRALLAAGAKAWIGDLYPKAAIAAEERGAPMRVWEAVRDAEGWTPLHVAAGNGHVAVVAALVAALLKEEEKEDKEEEEEEDTEEEEEKEEEEEEGEKFVSVRWVFVDQRSNELQVTPLYFAAMSGHTEVVQMLLRAGARVEHETIHHDTPLIAAASNGHTATVAALLKATAEAGNVVDYPDSHYEEPLEAAAEKGHMEVVRMVKDAGRPTARERHLYVI